MIKPKGVEEPMFQQLQLILFLKVNFSSFGKFWWYWS